MNKLILSEVTTNLKSIDEQLNARDAAKNKDVTITDNLQDKYDVSIFDGNNSKVGVTVDVTQLFYESVNMENSITKDSTKNLFDETTKYHQQILHDSLTTYSFIILWIILCFIICVLIRMIQKRGRNAKENNNKAERYQIYN